MKNQMPALCMKGMECFGVCVRTMVRGKAFITNVNQIKPEVLGPSAFSIQKKILVALSPNGEKILDKKTS